ncbi:unnamed protein product [Brassica oleracea var. botrytis]
MIHYDGLLLCILESSAMAVWNPCLNQVRWIKPETELPMICCAIIPLTVSTMVLDTMVYLKMVATKS